MGYRLALPGLVGIADECGGNTTWNRDTGRRAFAGHHADATVEGHVLHTRGGRRAFVFIATVASTAARDEPHAERDQGRGGNNSDTNLVGSNAA